MEKENNYSNSEINPDNIYQFDNYGIVKADSIEDLLYDKYNQKRSKKNYNNLFNNSYEIMENKINKSNIIEKHSLSEKSILKSISITNQEDNEYNVREISHNIELKYENNMNNVSDKESNPENEDINKDIIKNLKNIIKKEENKDNIKNNKNIEQNQNNINNKIINEENKNKINNKIKNINEENNIMNKNNKNKLKIIRCKEFHIKNNYINKEIKKNKPIKIILNINNKEKKELEINPDDSDTVKNISINNNTINKRESINNSHNNMNNKIDNKINIKEKEYFIKKENERKKDKNIKNDLKNKEETKRKISNNNKNNKIKMFLKDKQSKNIILINDKDTKDTKNIKKIHLLSPLERINKKNKENIKNPFSNNQNAAHNVPISSQCFIAKMRKSHDLIFNKIIPKKQRIFITKSYIKINNIISKKLMILPKTTKCYFLKEKKIINVRNHIPLQNVLNSYYFYTKEIDIKNKKRNKKVYIRKNNDKEEIEEENEFFQRQDNISKSKSKQKNKKRNDDPFTEIEIPQYDKDSPNIIIKIINPMKSSYKYGKIDIKTKSPNNLGKSKSCQRIIFKNLDNKENFPFNIQKNKRKIKKIKINNNRYESRKESTDFQIMKNKEIVNALNCSSRIKSNCFACVTLNRRKKFAEKFYRNLRLNNKNFSRSEKTIKMRTLKPYFSNNKNNSKNKLINFRNEEEKIDIKKLKKSGSIIEVNKKNSLLPKNNKEINEKRDNSLKQQNNISNNSTKKLSNFNYIEFPAIDSYFH